MTLAALFGWNCGDVPTFFLSQTLDEFTPEDAAQLVRSEVGSRSQSGAPPDADLASMVYLAATYLNAVRSTGSLALLFAREAGRRRLGAVRAGCCGRLLV